MTFRAHRTPHRRIAVLATLLAGAVGAAAAADEWLVYIGGGMEPVAGGWAERRGEVVFTQPGGTLVSVPHDEVDLAASAIITWQLGGRRSPPPRAGLPSPPPAAGEGGECVAARIAGWRGSESLELVRGEERELVHVACLDAPEIQHRFAELGWFGRATLSALQLEIRDLGVCVTETDPPQRDGDGHRIVHVTLADGRDYTALVIVSGLGLLRPEVCARAAYYRGLEDAAIAGEVGLWGPAGARPALAAVSHVASVAGGAAPPRRRAAGGG